MPGQKAEDRPDLTTRVFKAYLDALTKELYKDGIMGKHVSHCHVIEFQVGFRPLSTCMPSNNSNINTDLDKISKIQKRGLPHCHILIILAPEDRIRNADDIDTIVSAELPLEDCKLQRTLLNCMLHRDCTKDENAPCRKNGGSCSKR